MEGVIFFKKSRYADGGVMGVFKSSCLKQPGDLARGLMSSDGKDPEPGVCSEEAELALLSKPAAVAMLADAIAMMAACRCCRERETEKSNE